jgi:hypothetical protein
LSFLLIDPSPLVRGHAAWGLGEILRVGRRRDQEMIHGFLTAAESEEQDKWARTEMAQALGGN